jgi:methionyl-tRNA synthetase
LDEQLQAAAALAYTEATEKLEKLDFSAYLHSVSRLVARANKYIDETAPWILAKDENQTDRLATVMYNLLESIRIILVLTAPAMPTLMERANLQLGLWEDTNAVKWEEGGRWGLTSIGTRVTKGDVLFPRVDLKTLEEESSPASTETSIQEPAQKIETETDDGLVSIEDFARLDLRVAEIVSCEKMPKADKLLILKVRLGNEERTVVAGIAQHYSPDELIGKKVVIVANLKPTKLRGVMSQGMILAASDDKYVDVLTVTKDIASGNRVK